MLFVAFMVRPRIYSLIPSIQSEFRKLEVAAAIWQDFTIC